MSRMVHEGVPCFSWISWFLGFIGFLGFLGFLVSGSLGFLVSWFS